MKIHKYELKLIPKQVIELPAIRGDILSLQVQDESIVFWVAVEEGDLGMSPHEVEFVIVGTGDDCPDSDYDHVATVQKYEFVWHVFTKVPKN